MRNNGNQRTSEFNLVNLAIWSTVLILVFVFLSFYYISPGFSGLESDGGVEQAQVAREVARGNGLRTKYIRPHLYWQSKNIVKDKDLSVTKYKDAYNPPLNPIINSFVLRLGDNPFDYKPPKKNLETSDKIFKGDIKIVATSMFLFFMALLINLFFITKLFNLRIAVFTVVTMVFVTIFWEFTQTGLPQMLMLNIISLIFILSIYFIKSTYNGKERIFSLYSFILLFLIGVLFGLLILSHWVCLFTALGAVVFFSIYMLRKWFFSAILVLGLLLVIAYPVQRIKNITGSYFGYTPEVLLVNLFNGKDRYVMAEFDRHKDSIIDSGFTRIIATNLASQFENFSRNYGTVGLTVPVFMIVLFFRFSNPLPRLLYFLIISLWVFSLLGMGLKGLNNDKLAPAQIHVLFIPIFIAYTMVVLSILINRFVSENPELTWIKNIPIGFVIAIVAVPTLLNVTIDLGNKMRIPFIREDYPTNNRLSNILNAMVEDNEIVYTDSPWDVAWYGDTNAILLPKNQKQANEIKSILSFSSTPVVGIYFTDLTTNLGLTYDFGQNPFYRGWLGYITDIILRRKPSPDNYFDKIARFSQHNFFITDTKYRINKYSEGDY